MCVQVRHAFLGYSQTSPEDDEAKELVDMSVVWLRVSMLALELL